MAVDYEELPGSPSFHFARGASTAKRTVKIAWADITAFLTEIFPYQFASVSLPGIATWLVALDVEVDGLWEGAKILDDGQGNAMYDWAKVTVNYGTPKSDHGVQSGGANRSGPGGAAGSTGGAIGGGAGSDTTYVTHSVDMGGQIYTLPSQAIEWAGGGTANKVSEDVYAGIVVPTNEHTIAWNYVARPPWAAIRKIRGKVNEFVFSGAPIETVLFLGGQASQDVTTAGFQAWKLTYKFSEKNTGTDALPKGWNHFLRPDGPTPGTFQRLARKDGTPIYELEDFKELFVQGPLV